MLLILTNTGTVLLPCTLRLLARSLMLSNSAHPPDAQDTSRRLHSLLSGYGAALDAPVADLIPEMLAAYPDTKIILSLRGDGPAWWRSWYPAIGWMVNQSWATAVYHGVCFPVRFLRVTNWAMQQLGVRWRRDFGGIEVGMYDKHNDVVKRLVPRRNLLEYRVEEGWEPLCQSLGKEVPDAEFPNLNDGATIKLIILANVVMGFVVWCLYAASAVVLVWLARDPGLILGGMKRLLPRK